MHWIGSGHTNCARRSQAQCSTQNGINPKLWSVHELCGPRLSLLTKMYHNFPDCKLPGGALTGSAERDRQVEEIRCGRRGKKSNFSLIFLSLFSGESWPHRKSCCTYFLVVGETYTNMRRTCKLCTFVFISQQIIYTLNHSFSLMNYS